jgi:hypothetical protein
MKKFICPLLLICFMANAQSPTDSDYKIVDDIIMRLSKYEKDEIINLHVIPIVFAGQKSFFTEDVFESYTHPTLGVDTVKIKSLIKLLDYHQLSTQKSGTEKWDVKKFKSIVKAYPDNSKTLDGNAQYEIAKPIYGNNMSLAFVYVYRHCGFLNCNSGFVKIYSKDNSHWQYYATMPL